jgi:hypothetical protein
MLNYGMALQNEEYRKIGFLITKSESEFGLLGAGNIFSKNKWDDISSLEAKYTHDNSKSIELGVGETKELKPTGDGIYCIKLESSS